MALIVARPPGAAAHIYPGREPAVMRLLAPVVGGAFRGLRVQGVQLIDDEVRVQLAPGGDGGCTLVVARRAGMGCELDVSARRCEGGGGATELRRVRDALCARDHGDIWTVAPPRPGASHGLLTPLMARTGLPPGRVVAVCFALALLATLAAALLARAASAPAGRSDRRALTLALAVVVAAGVLTIRAGRRRAPDRDEGWARPAATLILDDDHDAWVHPPVFRALQQGYGHAMRWTPSRGALALRGLSVACAVLAVCALAFAHAAGARRPWTVALVALPLLAPRVTGEAVLARPYALATLFVALAAVASSALRDDDRDRAARWFVLVVAAGLAAWTDLIAGLFALSFVAAAWADPRALPRSRARARAAIAVAVVAWCAALAPGAVVASRAQVHPAPTAGEAPDLRAGNGLGRHGGLHLARSLASYGTLGRPDDVTAAGGLLAAVLLGAVLALAWRGGRRLDALALAAVYVIAWWLGMRLGLRPRNLLPLPYLTALVAARSAERASSKGPCRGTRT